MANTGKRSTAEIIEAVSVEAGKDGRIVLRNPLRAGGLRAARGSFAGRGRSVDELIADRRDEARREDV